MKEVETFSKTT